MRINSDTKLYGVLGYPVRHSLSPHIFNPAFEHIGFDGVYLAFEQKNTESAIGAMKTLGITGLSVTLPHKINAIKYIDILDETAKELECLNTICNDNGILTGYNFDGQGAIEALEEKCPNWADKKILFIGNGGAAKGIATSMAYKYNIKKIFFLVRNKEKAASIVEKINTYHTQAEIWQRTDIDIKKKIKKIDIIINTTPVGMHPKINETPLNKEWILPHMIIYDIVYHPRETRLIEEARASQAVTIGGANMFLGQAKLQFETWTKKPAPLKLMKKNLFFN